MEVKKSKKADLERKRAMFFQIGLIVTLGVVFVAFEWTTTDMAAGNSSWVEEEIVEEEAPPITRQEEVKPPPPPPPPQMSDIIEIVDNDVELDEELVIEDTDVDEDFEVDMSKFETQEEESGDPLPFFILEDKPEFPGGEKALLKYLSTNVRYPVICQENGIQGMVLVSFIIDETGQVTNVAATRAQDANLEREAVRVVKSMPKWKPGKQRGRAVKVSYSVPVRFRLQ
ncbi:TonB family protein [Carboxylicivirga caseinilyticus]|uniref:energy transducer TonB n=1 Tax=Carboxylicivirga caseinilyticus TaxID=3417572 RepID=UPI002AA809D0|nr:TonB family protein [uncultured Carboxylicivirga sp.]MCU4164471.1 TonB family protein [Marinilabiliaceae bacterium A049]